MGISITILILAVLWAAFFAWPTVSRRLSGTRRDSIGEFSKRVSAIGHFGGHAASHRIAPLRPPGPISQTPLVQRSAPASTAGSSPAGPGLPMSTDAQRRRRDALAMFGVAVFGTLLLAVVLGSPLFWVLHVVADLAFIGFVVLLVSIARRDRERRAKVHFLPQPAPVQSSALVLRRTASS